MRSRTPIALTLALILGAALISTGGPVIAQSTAGSCFWPRSIQGFRSIDDRTVYVKVSGGDIYALELYSRCHGVSWTHHRAAALQSRSGGSICEGRGSFVEIYARSSSGSQRRCSVHNIRKLTPVGIAALPARAVP